MKSAMMTTGLNSGATRGGVGVAFPFPPFLPGPTIPSRESEQKKERRAARPNATICRVGAGSFSCT